ncbi:MAG: DUF4097 family beta strand repeat-containing protein [Propionibacteriaceae bacterium]|jgi:DUF4097 and DUF4098 domain-containing protein YvlB|nr:DUF4097 family beta strand repeat-containing protein [Propionibacteriaceae bacterium]
MTKADFLAALAAALRTHGVAADDLLADFNDHFDEALRAGKTEAEICAVLGDPGAIAAELGDMTPPEPQSQTVPGPEPAADAAVVVHLTSANLRCEPADGPEPAVEVWRGGQRVDDDTIRVTGTAGSLRVVQHAEPDLLRRLFSAFMGLTVIVRLPGNTPSLAVYVGSGNIRVQNLTVGTSLTVEGKSGNAHLTAVCASQLTVTTRSGNLTVEDCAGTLVATCRSGNVHVRSHEGSVIRAAATSGNVRVGAGRISQAAVIETKSGSVDVDLGSLEAGLDLRCLSGNITFRVQELGGDITARTGSGNVTGYLKRDVRAVIYQEARGLSGQFPGAQGVPSAAGVPVVHLATRSGSAKVKQL